MEDLYSILGLSRSASDDKIKKAFRKMSLKYHPDRQNGKSEREKKEAEAKFKEVNSAYQILSDPEKKKMYDTYGVTDENDIPRDFDSSPFSMFSDFFGGRATNNTRAYYAPPQGRDVQMKISLGLKDIYSGCRKKVKYKINKRCPECRGEGGFGKEQCRVCNGTGMYTQYKHTSFGTMSSTSPCYNCGGEGYAVKNKCTKCKGQGFVQVEKTVEVEFPAGMMNGVGIPYAGDGHESSSPKGKNGDFIAVANWNFDFDTYSINGLDVYETVLIPWEKCLLGGKWEFKLPNEETRVINVPECSKPGDVIKLLGDGIMTGSKRGNYFLIVNYKVPEKLDQKTRELLEKI